MQEFSTIPPCADRLTRPATAVVRGWLRILILACLLTLVPCAPALAISDEIQVYTDEINEPGERGLELHINTTPRGRKTAEYEGDIAPYRGLRVTPEFSWGLTKTLEAGLYVPMTTSANGTFYVGGLKGRLKWLPIKTESGWYAGANAELSNVSRAFSESRLSTELRIMAGYHGDDWLLGINPIFDWGLSRGFRGSPEVLMTWKATRRVAEGIALGGEYYNGLGTLANRLPAEQQQRALYLVMDFERKPWIFNLGIGHGLNSATDAWTIKAIFEVPF